VKKNYPDSPVEIEADKSKLTIAFTNLVINAIEAMERDKGVLAVSISPLQNGYSVSIRTMERAFLKNIYHDFLNLSSLRRKME
jgi:signal transduction histidine kinase